MSPTVPLPPPTYSAIALLVLTTVWLEDTSPKRRKAFLTRLARAIEAHKSGVRRLKFDRPPEQMQAVDAEADKAFAYLEAWIEAARPLLGD